MDGVWNNGYKNGCWTWQMICQDLLDCTRIASKKSLKVSKREDIDDDVLATFHAMWVVATTSCFKITQTIMCPMLT